MYNKISIFYISFYSDFLLLFSLSSLSKNKKIKNPSRCASQRQQQQPQRQRHCNVMSHCRSVCLSVSQSDCLSVWLSVCQSVNNCGTHLPPSASFHCGCCRFSFVDAAIATHAPKTGRDSSQFNLSLFIFLYLSLSLFNSIFSLLELLLLPLLPSALRKTASHVRVRVRVYCVLKVASKLQQQQIYNENIEFHFSVFSWLFFVYFICAKFMSGANWTICLWQTPAEVSEFQNLNKLT